MKKTMFITSVIMVVVLAIALTTSSLAWFTAQGAQNVSLQQFTVTTAHAAAVGAGLEISPDGQIWLTQLPMNNTAASSNTVLPKAPCGDDSFINGSLDTNYELYKAIENAKSKKVINSYVEAVGTQGQEGYVAAHNELQFSGDSFDTSDIWRTDLYIRNTGTTDWANLPVNLRVSSAVISNNEDGDTIAATLWVAVFVLEETEQNSSLVVTNATLLALAQGGQETIAMSYAASAAMFADGAPVSAVNKQLATNHAALAVDHTTLAGSQDGGATPGAAQHICVLAWFDGAQLNSNSDSTIVTINLSFGTPVAANNP